MTKQIAIDVVGVVRVKGSRISRSLHFLLQVKELTYSLIYVHTVYINQQTNRATFCHHPIY